MSSAVSACPPSRGQLMSWIRHQREHFAGGGTLEELLRNLLVCLSQLQRHDHDYMTMIVLDLHMHVQSSSTIYLYMFGVATRVVRVWCRSAPGQWIMIRFYWMTTGWNLWCQDSVAEWTAVFDSFLFEKKDNYYHFVGCGTKKIHHSSTIDVRYLCWKKIGVNDTIQCHNIIHN